MRKNIIFSISLLLLSAITPQLHRVFNNTPIIKFHPFPLAPSREISYQWYLKDIGDLLSFSCMMWLVLFLLQVIESYMEKQTWNGLDKMLDFLKTWERVFNITFIISIFDLAHYLISFKQTEWFYLLLNAVFWVMTCYYLFKLKQKH